MILKAVRKARARKKLLKLGVNEQAFAVREQKLTYLSYSKLAQIVTAIEKIKETGIKGMYIEAGCALGGSAIVIADVMPTDELLRVYDTFAMIPPPTKEDPDDVKERYEIIKSGLSKGIDGDEYYGYVDDLKGLVKANLVKNLAQSIVDRVELIEGLLQDTMAVDQPVAFAHIDVDWYDPVKVSLERIAPQLSVGGCIILDDYFDWGGCRKAADEFLSENSGMFEKHTDMGGLKLVKV